VAVRVDHAHLGGLQLSAAERRLWDAFPERALADLGDGAKGRDGAEKWGQERTVRPARRRRPFLRHARRPRRAPRRHRGQPVREYYLVGRHDTGHSERWRTEIGWPIFRTSSAALSSPGPRD